MLYHIQQEENTIVNNVDQEAYIHKLCIKTYQVLDKLVKTNPTVIKNSCFVYVGLNKKAYGINTEAWHCVTIAPDILLSIEPTIRSVICELIISNIQDLLTNQLLIDDTKLLKAKK